MTKLVKLTYYKLYYNNQFTHEHQKNQFFLNPQDLGISFLKLTKQKLIVFKKIYTCKYMYIEKLNNFKLHHILTPI